MRFPVLAMAAIMASLGAARAQTEPQAAPVGCGGAAGQAIDLIEPCARDGQIAHVPTQRYSEANGRIQWQSHLDEGRDQGGIAGGDPNTASGRFHGSLPGSHPHRRPRNRVQVEMDLEVIDSEAYEPGVDPRDFKENYRAPAPVYHRPRADVYHRPADAPVILLTPRRVRDVYTAPRPAVSCGRKPCDPCARCQSYAAHPTYPTYAYGSASALKGGRDYAVLPEGQESGTGIVLDKRRLKGPTYGGHRRALYRYVLRIGGGHLVLVSGEGFPRAGQCVAYDAQPLSARLRVSPSRLCGAGRGSIGGDMKDVVYYPGKGTPGSYQGSYRDCQRAYQAALGHHGYARTRAMEQASYVCAIGPGDRLY